MPRANRYFLPGHVWHITHRCHQKDFLLKFRKDRQRWRHWLFEAKKRYGLSVLNYIITSNHIRLLVRDCGQGEIARSMQLIAGHTAQGYNLRKGRKGHSGKTAIMRLPSIQINTWPVAWRISI